MYGKSKNLSLTYQVIVLIQTDMSKTVKTNKEDLGQREPRTLFKYFNLLRYLKM